GKRPHTTGVSNNTTDPRTLLKNDRFLPEQFNANGYFTARVGKIAHSQWESRVRWDVALDEPGSDNSEGSIQEGVGHIPAWGISALPDSELGDGQVATLAIALLNENSDKTFFIGVGFRKPHRPLIAPKKYFDLYDASDITLPVDAMNDEGETPEEKRN